MNQVDLEMAKIERGFAAVEKFESIKDTLVDDDALDAAVIELNVPLDAAYNARPDTAVGVLRQISLIFEHEIETIEDAHIPVFENAVRVLKILESQ